MTAVILPFQRPVPQLFILGAPDTDMARLVAEVDRMARLAPELLTMIDADLDAYGLDKKRAREADRLWRESQNQALPGFDVTTRDGADRCDALLTGRPRMPAQLVLLFLVLRGYLGGFKNRKVASLMADSMTLRIYLQASGWTLPAESTLIDNVNAVSNQSREKILDMQIRHAKEAALDDFKKLTCDSTAVDANSRWPTESGIIAALLRRIETTLRGLAAFGVNVTLRDVLGQLISEVEREHKQIQLSAGKKNSARRRKTLYRRIFKHAGKLHGELTAALARADRLALRLDLPPTAKFRLATRLETVEVDLRNLDLAIENSKARINAGKKVPAPQKVLSLADDDAAMIVKGGREPVLGYKPQIARSGNGFVTAIITPLGNANDAGQIEVIADAAITRTGVVPKIMSFDDGYVNDAARQKYRAAGADVVSFSGSKGKRSIDRATYDSEAYVAARNDRSAVESIIFTLKHNYDLDEVMRRGLVNVRGELLEKVIAHNAFRTIALQSAAAERPAKAS